MNADGSDERRISFGGGGYASPRWSPDGEHIAFTRIAGPVRRIGVIAPDGTGERIVTTGSADQAPSWGPGGRQLLFQARDPASGRTGLFMTSLAGGEVRPVATPVNAADPSWSGARE